MRLRLLACAALAGAFAIPAAASSGGAITLTPVSRLPFPERGFVVDLPRGVASGSPHAEVLENGAGVSGVKLNPVAASGVNYGTMLAVDASDSMRGTPSAAALAAARTFVTRRNPNQKVGVVAFNGNIDVVHQPTANGAALNGALAQPPALSYGTRIYDALIRSLVVLEHAHISSGSIVLLSDGADLGSKSTLQEVLARATRDHVRVFTVGLRSGAFDPVTLRRIAAGTGGSYAEASSPSQLAPIYDALGGRLANEYLLEYRSAARPGAHVDVAVTIGGVGTATTGYVVATPSNLAPFHQSLFSRFVLSGGSLAVLALLVAGLLAWALTTALRRPANTVVGRMGAFVTIDETGKKSSTTTEPAGRRRVRSTARPTSALGRWRARLATEFEIAEISIRPDVYLAVTVVLTVVAFIILVLISVPLALLAILVPVIARSWVTRKVEAVRNAFADQLPDTLQLLASALRSGHSFGGALSVVVEESAQPSQREFRQVLADDQLGIPVEESFRGVAARMASREMEQVALLGELQRIAGGNSAEVLDTVVETIRERVDLRRLARTLTAQGRMARWILTLMPFGVAVFLWLAQPSLIRPLFQSPVGQVALVITTLMAVAGSFWIKHIVEIKV